MLVLLLLAVAVPSACSVADNYQLLSFFFDGVPNPKLEAERRRAAEEARRKAEEERAKRLGRKVDRAPHFLHTPFRQQRCDGCHLAMKPQPGVPRWLQGLGRLKAPKEELCKQCHEAPEARYVHGPVAAIACSTCHHHHDSPYPYQLLAKDSGTLCAKCHTGDTFLTEKKHEEYKDEQCVDCHNPHASQHRYFLYTDEEKLERLERIRKAKESGDRGDGSLEPEPSTVVPTDAAFLGNPSMMRRTLLESAKPKKPRSGHGG